MRTTTFWLAACALTLGCTDQIQNPTEPRPAREPTYVLFGTVRDQDGLPLPAAIAEIVEGTYNGWVSQSNAAGNFSFVGVRGVVKLVVWKEGYDFHEQRLSVNGDVALQFDLPKLESDGIILGRTIRARVRAGSPPCDPVGWDARAPCRRFSFTPPESGLLTLTISWMGGSTIDATIVRPSGGYLAWSEEVGEEKIKMFASVEAGVTYEVRINSYYDTQTFELLAELRPLQ